MATGGTTSACATDSDCTYCAFPFAPTSTTFCPCSDCEWSVMTKEDCAVNTVAWNTYCIDTCDNNSIACGSPASLPLCINGVCTAQLDAGGAGGAGGSSSAGGTTSTGGMTATTGGAIASGGTSSNGTVATDAGDAGETYTITCSTGTYSPLDKTCQVDSDCFIAMHLISCCGLREAIGLNVSSKSAFDTEESSCDINRPMCNIICSSGTPAEDGHTVSPEHPTIDVHCDQGICLTYIP